MSAITARELAPALGQAWQAEPDPALPVAGNRVGAHWIDSARDGWLEVRSPADGTPIGQVPCADRATVGQAVAAARAGADRMARLSRHDRAQLLMRAADRVEQAADELAGLLAREQGKPLGTEARGEIAFATNGLRSAAEHIKWLEGSCFFPPDGAKRGFTFLRPRGVYGIIVPWNFPVAVPVLYYLAPGLAAGNSIVWVPAPSTSLVSARLMACLLEADLPEGAVNLVTGPGAVVGDEVAGHPGVDAVGFTGSTAVGALVARRAAGKPMSLELGGNGPTIVFDDADIADAARKIALACFTNAGQVCTSTERILVHRRVHDAFVDALLAEAGRVRLGHPLDPATTMGPLHNARTLAKVESHVANSRTRGAGVLAGGAAEPAHGSPLYYPPTVIAGVAADSLLNVEETFGPVAPVLMFEDDDHLADLVRRSPYGLFAGLFTSSLKRAFRWAEALRVGTVHVNERSSYWDINIPGGGASGSASGVGRLGMRQSIVQMSDEVAVTVDLA